MSVLNLSALMLVESVSVLNAWNCYISFCAVCTVWWGHFFPLEKVVEANLEKYTVDDV